MEGTKLEKLTADLKAKYPDAGIKKIEVNEGTGTSTFFLTPETKALAYLKEGGVIPKGFNPLPPELS